MTIPDERNEIGRQNVQITSADFEKIKREMTGESIVEDSDSRSSTMYKMLTKDNPFFRNPFKNPANILLKILQKLCRKSCRLLQKIMQKSFRNP